MLNLCEKAKCSLRLQEFECLEVWFLTMKTAFGDKMLASIFLLPDLRFVDENGGIDSHAAFLTENTGFFNHCRRPLVDKLKLVFFVYGNINCRRLVWS